MSPSGPTGVAVVGMGSAGHQHLQALRTLADVRPIAVSSRPTKLEELSDQGVQVAPTIAEAAADGASLAVIATQTGRHVRDGLDALAAGCHLLVEKPLAVDAAEATTLVEASLESDRMLYVGCVLRFAEMLNRFRSLLDRIGRPHAVRIEAQSFLPDWRPDRPYEESYSADPAEGGVLRDLIHEIDYATWLFGWPRSVTASLRNLGRLGIGSEESADLAWVTESGCRVTVMLDYLTRPTRRTMTAYGENGTLRWDAVLGSVALDEATGESHDFQSAQTRDEMFADQARAFVAVATGVGVDGVEPATGVDGVRALALCDAAREASRTGAEQEVQYP